MYFIEITNPAQKKKQKGERKKKKKLLLTNITQLG
jgi:hypothetical protein